MKRQTENKEKKKREGSITPGFTSLFGHKAPPAGPQEDNKTSGTGNRSDRIRQSDGREKTPGESYKRNGDEPRRYDVYVFTAGEWAEVLGKCLAACALLDYLFYRSLYMMLIVIPAAVLYVRHERMSRMIRRKRLINEHFRDALVALNIAVQAGYSVENAFCACTRDLEKLYPSGTDILEEFHYMENQLYLSVPIEDLFMDLGNRTGAEDIENFAAVFYTAKRTGGDMSLILQKVGRMLGDKIEVKKEIAATVSAKKYEQSIMSMMPIGIILYLKLTSPGFLDVLYGNALGVGVMSACLGVYAFSWWLGRRIVDIEV